MRWINLVAESESPPMPKKLLSLLAGGRPSTSAQIRPISSSAPGLSGSPPFVSSVLGACLRAWASKAAKSIFPLAVNGRTQINLIYAVIHDITADELNAELVQILRSLNFSHFSLADLIAQTCCLIADF